MKAASKVAELPSLTVTERSRLPLFLRTTTQWHGRSRMILPRIFLAAEYSMALCLSNMAGWA